MDSFSLVSFSLVSRPNAMRGVGCFAEYFHALPSRFTRTIVMRGGVPTGAKSFSDIHGDLASRISTLEVGDHALRQFCQIDHLLPERSAADTRQVEKIVN